jgi:hypothetical protein
MMLRQVVANVFTHTAFEELFVIDHSLPNEVVEQIATPADVAAALDCWRNKMVAAIDVVVHRCKGEADAKKSRSAGSSQPPSGNQQG